MYPQYWTTSIGGTFMKYSYEYKLECIEKYRQGKWPETPEGIKEHNFKIKVLNWSKKEAEFGPESLRHRNRNRVFSAEEKYELVAKVLAGAAYKSTAMHAEIEDSMLHQWVRTYKIKGYEGLAAQRKGRPPKEPQVKKEKLPAELTPSEREEMIRLKAENEYLRAENEVIKKRIALRRERWAEELKAKKQRSSKNSEKKDMT